MNIMRLASLGLLACAMGAPSVAGSRPNVVMLFVDDMGYGDVGFNGNPVVPTPNIDALAYGGMRLGTWYSGAPLCSASRAALLTGRQTPRTGVPPVLDPVGNEGLPTNETTLGQLAKSAGYATAA
jgi:arylsulfatase A